MQRTEARQQRAKKELAGGSGQLAESQQRKTSSESVEWVELLSYSVE